METFTYSCPGCGAALEYDAPSKKMVCKFCNEYYIPELLGVPEIMDNYHEADMMENALNMEPNTDESVETRDDMMQVRIYSCGNCAAEIMTNDVEVSGFCSYCGQPTLMFDRVSWEKKPDKVIPFIISKQEALNLAKQRFEKAKYQGDSLQNLTVDSVNGIYMPYWNITTFLSLDAVSTVRNKHGIHSYDDHEEMEKDVVVDASRSFNDDIGFYLNPFDMNDAVKFTPAYLSGFYADRADDNLQIKEQDARDRLQNILKEMIMDRTPEMPDRAMREKYSVNNIPGIGMVYDFQVKECYGETRYVESLFLPVYFITFMIHGEKVIILVNGQTGKVIGNIPVDQEQFKARQMLDMCIFGVIFAIAGFLVMGLLDIIWGTFMFALIAFFIYAYGNNSKKKYLERYEKTNSEKMFSLAKRRR